MSDDYRSRVKDADFRCQYDTSPNDPEVDALLRGIEPPRAEVAPSQATTPRLNVIEPASQFKWLKPLR